MTTYAELRENAALQRMAAFHGFEYKAVVSRNLDYLRSLMRWDLSHPRFGQPVYEERVAYWLKDGCATHSKIEGVRWESDSERRRAKREAGVGLFDELIRRRQEMEELS